jgi:glycosyltransferase involved in cell wall biosynthesis
MAAQRRGLEGGAVVNGTVESSRGRIAYVTSLFPKLTETFILREVQEMERAGITVALYSIRPRPSEPLHADARPFLERTHYAPWFGLEHLVAFVSLSARRPGKVAKGLAYLSQDTLTHARYPKTVARTLGCLAKMFLFTRRMEREGVVHVHAHFASTPTTLAVFAAKVLGITYSFTGHAWDIFVPASQAGLAAKISGAEFVATCTDFNTKVLTPFCRSDRDRSKILLNYHGLDLSRYRPAGERDVQRIVAGGSLVEKKGLEFLIDATVLLRDRGVGFRVEIVGDGPQRSLLEHAIARHGLQEVVQLVGSMPHEQLVERMRTSAMVVLPSIETRERLMDGIPNLLIEGSALEVPVVATRLSGIPELVVDGETGWLVPPRDADALADAIEGLLRDPARGRELGRRGRQRVEAMFDLGHNAQELVLRFQEILERRIAHEG